MISPRPTMAHDARAENSAARIILVEDEQTLRESLVDYLAYVGYDVTAVDTGLKFYHALAEQTFAVAIIDRGLPDMCGLQLAEYIRNNTAMHSIMLTACGTVEDRIAGYESGADLYMVKPVDYRELASALSRMISRASQNGSAKPSPHHWQLNRHNSTLVTPACSIVTLTSKELDFLLCLAVSTGETVSRASILKALGYTDDEFSNRALESLIRRLRRKIEGNFAESPILTRHGVGYSFSAPLSLK